MRNKDQKTFSTLRQKRQQQQHVGIPDAVTAEREEDSTLNLPACDQMRPTKARLLQEQKKKKTEKKCKVRTLLISGAICVETVFSHLESSGVTKQLIIMRVY